MNFIPYLKLNLKMVSTYAIVMVVMGGLIWLIIGSVYGLFLFPLAAGGLVWPCSKAMKLVYHDSLFGDGAALHMSLPVDAKSMVLTKLVINSGLLLLFLACIIVPLLLSPFMANGTVLNLFLNEAYTAAGGSDRGLVLLFIAVLALCMLGIMAVAVDLFFGIWYRCLPLRHQSKTLHAVGRGLVTMLFIGFIIWNNLRDHEESLILKWLGAEYALPGTAAVLAAEILIFALAARGCVKLLETKYQKL